MPVLLQQATSDRFSESVKNRQDKCVYKCVGINSVCECVDGHGLLLVSYNSQHE